jgi:hypothetical protein
MNQSQPDPLVPILRRLAACVRLLLSESAGERDGAVLGVQRIMRGLAEDRNGINLHALAAWIEPKQDDKPSSGRTELSDETKQKFRTALEQARAEAYAEGVAAAEARQHGTGAFRNTDGTLDWKEITLFLQRKLDRFSDKERKFINDMAARIPWNREPSQGQHQWLHSLFFRLGGKIT